MEYRREIDGLRAVAVLPVILFHAGIDGFSGGFVGVDIFFVISGYLITTIILSEKQKDAFSLVNFYERRARRILPALFLVMLFSLPFAWFWLLPGDYKTFSQSLVAVSLFSSNVLFWQEVGYFDTAAELKPLLHTWSLAVEEQYYIFFPPLLMFVWHYRKRWIFFAIIILGVVSLSLAEWGASNHPSAAFFLLPTRAWELMVGASVAFFLLYGKSHDQIINASKVFSELAGFVGLLLITYSIFAFDDEIAFPSIYALVPTIGVAFIILFSSHQTFIGKLLGTRTLVVVGMMSYSLYLWHQPVLAFARHRNIVELEGQAIFFLIATIFILAFISWKYVEKPFRNKTLFSRRSVFYLSGVGSVFFIILGLVGHLENGFSDRDYFAKSKIYQTTAGDNYCHAGGKRSIKQLKEGDVCQVGKGNTDTVVLGDSHAGALFSYFEKIGLQEERRFWAISYGWCPPILDFELLKYGENCIENAKASYDLVLSNPSIRNVILAANWGFYTSGYRNDISPSAATYKGVDYSDLERNSELFESALVESVQKLQKYGKRVFIVTPVPEFKYNTFDSLQKLRLYESVFDERLFQISNEQYNERNKEVFSIFQRLNGVTFVKSADVFCNGEICSSLSSNNDALLSDDNHVSEKGAELLGKLILNAMKN